eukprot:1147322-Pelagomonas_calceolata.AAC.19
MYTHTHNFHAGGRAGARVLGWHCAGHAWRCGDGPGPAHQDGPSGCTGPRNAPVQGFHQRDLHRQGEHEDSRGSVLEACKPKWPKWLHRPSGF